MKSQSLIFQLCLTCLAASNLYAFDFDVITSVSPDRRIETIDVFDHNRDPKHQITAALKYVPYLREHSVEYTDSEGLSGEGTRISICPAPYWRFKADPSKQHPLPYSGFDERDKQSWIWNEDSTNCYMGIDGYSPKVDGFHTYLVLRIDVGSGNTVFGRINSLPLAEIIFRFGKETQRALMWGDQRAWPHQQNHHISLGYDVGSSHREPGHYDLTVKTEDWCSFKVFQIERLSSPMNTETRELPSGEDAGIMFESSHGASWPPCEAPASAYKNVEATLQRLKASTVIDASFSPDHRHHFQFVPDPDGKDGKKGFLFAEHLVDKNGKLVSEGPPVPVLCGKSVSSNLSFEWAANNAAAIIKDGDEDHLVVLQKDLHTKRLIFDEARFPDPSHTLSSPVSVLSEKDLNKRSRDLFDALVRLVRFTEPLGIVYDLVPVKPRVEVGAKQEPDHSKPTIRVTLSTIDWMSYKAVSIEETLNGKTKRLEPNKKLK